MKKTRDRAASTRALLDAGIKAFSAKGYDAATTKEIARLAGLNEQLITRYFGGKMGLLVAVYRDLLEHQEDDLAYEASPRQATVPLEIAHFLAHKNRHFRATDKLMTIMLVRLLIDQETAAHYDLSFMYRMSTVLAKRLRVFQREGRIRPDCDTLQVSESVMAQAFVDLFLTPAIVGLDPDRIAADCEKIVRITCEGIVPPAS